LERWSCVRQACGSIGGEDRGQSEESEDDSDEPKSRFHNDVPSQAARGRVTSGLILLCLTGFIVEEKNVVADCYVTRCMVSQNQYATDEGGLPSHVTLCCVYGDVEQLHPVAE
jgi:hypothetical protein